MLYVIEQASRSSDKFPYSQPEHIEQYQAYFEQAYRFTPHIGSFIVPTIVKNHCGLQLSLPENIMRKPFTESNQAIKRYHLNQVDRSGFSVGIIQYVYQTIGQYLAQNKEVTLEKIALGLSVSPATLKRKLANHHTSYQNLLDLFRQQQAIFQLTEQGYNNEKVASELHFSDLTNFRRSFKRWTGLTPNEIKQAL
ncbi:helix-turn-helix domain-containing protein [Thalassotalea castellviae]|uniref:Helix-turn-helix domain-containing protein n=1 Tax=Thalassotalea castellviae TaxID=3075612 RepID=A0ABU3A6I9_9GAMM|nr:helix-turn-helix domain-containing protein [Thalassotalea sp. W431]MDT0604708.1 helix-turn-helix domain-containing protein [Thalassotalea sp. W431]